MRICPNCEKKTEELVCPDDGFHTVEAMPLLGGQDDPFIGTVFEDRYRIEAVLGSGGMGTVYRATQLAVGRPVAIKILSTDLAKDLQSVARFHQEARAVASLRHPNTIRLIDFGRAQGIYLYLVVELLDGESLGDLLDREAPLEPARIIRIVRQVFDALAEAHGFGIVHRDLKPENLFVTRVGLQEDFVKLLDFGIAKVHTSLEGGHSITNTGITLGSPGYMSPEQVQSEPVTAQSDIYSVGTIAYEMLTGVSPFRANNAMQWLMAHVYEDPVPPQVDGEQVEGPLVDFILRCLAKDPADRPASAAAAVVELDACGDEPVRKVGGDARDRPTLKEMPAMASGVRLPPPQAGAQAASAAQAKDTAPAVDPPKPPRLEPALDTAARAPLSERPATVDLPLRHADGPRPASRPQTDLLLHQRTARAPTPVVRSSRGWIPLILLLFAGAVVAGSWHLSRYSTRAANLPTPSVLPSSDAGPDAGPTAAPANGDASNGVAPEVSSTTDADEGPGPEVAGAGDGVDGGDRELSVVIATDPPGARVFRGDEELGLSTLTVTWSAGEPPPTLLVRKRYYAEQKVALRRSDDGKTRLVPLE